MWDFYRNLNASEKRTLRVLGRYAAMMFIVPVTIAISLPLIISSWGMDHTFIVFIIAGSSTASVFIIAGAFSYLAYCEDERSGEAQAKNVMGKSIKND